MSLTRLKLGFSASWPRWCCIIVHCPSPLWWSKLAGDQYVLVHPRWSSYVTGRPSRLDIFGLGNMYCRHRKWLCKVPYVLARLFYIKTDGVFKEVIISYVCIKSPLLLTITFHLHHGRWLPLVFTPSGVLLNLSSGKISGTVRRLLPYLTYPRCYTQFTSGTLAKWNFRKVYPDTINRSRGNNLVSHFY